MNRLAVASALALWAGATVLLGELRWVRRRSLTERLRPYVAGGATELRRRPGLADSLADLAAPLAAAGAERLSRLLGPGDELEVRLARIHADVDVPGFRLRQVGWSALAMALGGLASMALAVPPPAALVFVLGSPLLVFLGVEQRLAGAARAWQQRVFIELPVVAEQLALLLSSGWSLTAALDRIARRGGGACGRDLGRVCRRIRQGVSEADALSEWAVLARVDAVDRLVAVLALDRQTGDLGRLVAEEARSVRRDVHRRLIESVERRSQQVWIPVTVATLVPGSLFMGIPFIEALRLFGT